MPNYKFLFIVESLWLVGFYGQVFFYETWLGWVEICNGLDWLDFKSNILYWVGFGLHKKLTQPMLELVYQDSATVTKRGPLSKVPVPSPVK